MKRTRNWRNRKMTWLNSFIPFKYSN
jgi:hypothetical protein